MDVRQVVMLIFVGFADNCKKYGLKYCDGNRHEKQLSKMIYLLQKIHDTVCKEVLHLL